MIRQGAPITWREAAEKFLQCLGSIRTDAQVLQVKECYLHDWPATLYGNKPLDSGLSLPKAWEKLIAENPELGTKEANLLAETPPKVPDDFLLATYPRLKPNQRAITLLALEVAKAAHSWVYVCQPTGTGKTTELLELGYLAGLDLLPQKKSSKITVRLVVPSTKLVAFNKELFEEKLVVANPRVVIVWQDLESFTD